MGRIPSGASVMQATCPLLTGEEAHLSTAQRHSVELRLSNRDLQANCLLASEPRRPGGGSAVVAISSV